MDAANAWTGEGLAVIVFDIPDTDPGYADVDSHLTGGDVDPDVFVITPKSAFPALTRGYIVINAQSQQSATGDTNPFGPEIVLDGSRVLVLTDNPNNVPSINGLVLVSDSNVIPGVDDVAGNHDGTLLNGTTFAPGIVGQAFSFDGVDDVVATPLVVETSLPTTRTTAFRSGEMIRTWSPATGLE